MKLIIEIPFEAYEQIISHTEGEISEGKALDSIRHGKPFEEKHGIDWESIEKEKILKARKGKYVIYDVDYFLKHLHHEIYILEHERLERSRREKEAKENETY